MPTAPLPGKPGNAVKARLESAAVCQQVHDWEDLRRYLIQDDKWIWDDAILLSWQTDITQYYLNCLRENGEDEETILGIAKALEDGQHLKAETKAEDTSDILNEAASDHGTVRQHEHPQASKSNRIIFLVSWGKKSCDGINVGHTDKPISRISSRIVLERWQLKDDTYETLIPGEYATGSKSLVIDLTWEPEPGGKTQTTTFEVVADTMLTRDAEFGQNQFESVLSSRKPGKGHSVTKSTSAVETSRPAKPAGPRSQSGRSTTSSHRRRATIPQSSGPSMDMNEDEFIRQELVMGLVVNAKLKYQEQKQKQTLLEADTEDDEGSMTSDQEQEHSTPGTSVSANASAKKGNRARRESRNK